MPDTDSETVLRSNEQTIAGGGRLQYRITHPRERTADALVSKIGIAIEAVNAAYFNEPARESIATKRADTDYKLRAIQAAVDAANDSETFGDNVEGDLAYVVEEGYYPDDYTHYVDVTGVPLADRSRAFLRAQSELAQRGYVINSLRSDDAGHLTKFHVVSLRWLYDARAHGKRDGSADSDG